MTSADSRVEIAVAEQLDHAEDERRPNWSQALTDGGESRRLEVEGMLAKMAFFDKVALQEALWKEQQIEMSRLGLPREVFDAAERGLKVSEDLRCLTGADA